MDILLGIYLMGLGAGRFQLSCLGGRSVVGGMAGGREKNRPFFVAWMTRDIRSYTVLA